MRIAGRRVEASDTGRYVGAACVLGDRGFKSSKQASAGKSLHTCQKLVHVWGSRFSFFRHARLPARRDAVGHGGVGPPLALDRSQHHVVGQRGLANLLRGASSGRSCRRHHILSITPADCIVRGSVGLAESIHRYIDTSARTWPLSCKLTSPAADCGRQLYICRRCSFPHARAGARPSFPSGTRSHGRPLLTTSRGGPIALRFSPTDHIGSCTPPRLSWIVTGTTRTARL